MNDIAAKILSVIEKKGLSYSELAEMTKISKSALQRYATGETAKIPLDRLKLISDALGVSQSYLMGWDDAEIALTGAGMGIDDIATELEIPVEVVREIVAGNAFSDSSALKKVIRVAELLLEAKAPTPEGERKIDDDDIKFALWGDSENIDDEDLEDVKRYAEFVRQRKKDKQQ